MSSAAEYQAARATGPIASTSTTGLRGVARAALSGTTQSWAIPPELRGKWVRMVANSQDDVQYAFGEGSAPGIVLTQISVLGTGHGSAGTTIFSRTSEERLVPPSATHLAFRSMTVNTGTSGALGGWFELYCSETP